MNNTELSDKIETYEIVKKGWFVEYRAGKELDKIKAKENIELISITADYDFRNPLNLFNNEYKIVYKKK